ncbi:MAG: ATP-binding cassette domain-containing protein [Candidatus Cloacimonetes bacterium]|nr:ATP-binding cassette domain-containing protein [Candidatus Cloacimonadota bacterium]MBT5419441.1 ATP-binding cassette domain-containing protein [Candidatus Cloacimonadota bacterium]
MIRIKDLTKNYGSVRAVDNINFEINEGEILGFLGPNGAGKTTTLRMITCFLSPTSGNIEVENMNINNKQLEIKKLIGYLPEHNPLYIDMTVYDYLKFISDIREIPNFSTRIKQVIAQCGLGGVVQKTINILSKGYKQRVGIAQAILHDPKILILDEPTSGLDPNQIVEIRELIKELGKEKTLIISSHILQEVQAVCSRIIIINEGKIVADGSTEELQSAFQNKTKLVLELMAPENEIPEISEKLNEINILSISPLSETTFCVEVEFDVAKDVRAEVFDFIKTKDWKILEMHRQNISLEAVFRSLTIEGGEK